MDSTRTNDTLSTALAHSIALIDAIEGPHCDLCRSGCRECVADVEHDAHERLFTRTERVGMRCDCGKRCGGETFRFEGVAYCSLTCVSIAIGEDADYICTDDVVAKISAAILSYWLALNAERTTARDSSAKLTVRPGAEVSL